MSFFCTTVRKHLPHFHHPGLISNVRIHLVWYHCHVVGITSERHICPAEPNTGWSHCPRPPHTLKWLVQKKSGPEIKHPHPNDHMIMWVNIQADHMTPPFHADTWLLTTAAKADLHILMRFAEDKRVQLHLHVVLNVQGDRRYLRTVSGEK